MDFFINEQNCIDRLFAEWDKYKGLIIAYDFDNTVFDYYQKGHTFEDVIKLIRDCRSVGLHLTVFTSCNDDRLPELESYLNQNNIPYDSINETPDYIPFKGRKVYFNLLLDDRAGLPSAYRILTTVISMIRSSKYWKDKQDIDF